MSIDNDVDMLAQACSAIERTTPRMRRATLEFLWNKFITHAPTAGSGSSPPVPVVVDPLAETTEVQVRNLLKEMCCDHSCKKKATRRWLISRSPHESARYAPYCDKHGKQHGIEE